MILPILYNLYSPTYIKDIKPLFKHRCSECHDYMPGRDWQKYEDAHKYSDKIKKRVYDKSMPLGRTLPQSEIDLIIEWVDEGSKE